MTKILAFSGSLSENSVNKKLIKVSIEELEKMGHQVSYIELNDYPLPIYSPNILPKDFPESANKLAQLMQENPIWLIATPEHNYSIPSCLKNIIDWVSRTPDNKPNMAAFSERIIALMSASPSTFGASRALRTLREILSLLGCIVIPNQTSVGNAYNAFDEQGNLIDTLAQKNIKATLNQLNKFAIKLLA